MSLLYYQNENRNVILKFCNVEKSYTAPFNPALYRSWKQNCYDVGPMSKAPTLKADLVALNRQKNKDFYRPPTNISSSDVWVSDHRNNLPLPLISNSPATPPVPHCTSWFVLHSQKDIWRFKNQQHFCPAQVTQSNKLVSEYLPGLQSQSYVTASNSMQSS